MDYFLSVVAEYLQADRANFLNTEYFLTHKMKPTEVGPPEWLVDVLCVNMREQRVYLCEISYARPLRALEKRLREWASNWETVVETVRRDAHTPENWPVHVRVFVPEDSIEAFRDKLDKFGFNDKLTVEKLEVTLPWRYARWARRMPAGKVETLKV